MTTTTNKPLALVTGASSGIGLELAKEFARRGYDLVIAAENPEITTVASVIEQMGVTVNPVQVDLSVYEGVESLYTEVKGLNRPLDAVAINAGVGVGGNFATETDLEKELNLIDLNVTSSVHLAKRVLADMVARNDGKVLFTSSIASAGPGPFEAVYAASKAFIYSFSEALRSELKETNVTVTALLPGATETNFFHRADMDNTKVGQSEKDDAAQVAKEGIDALVAGEGSVVAGSFKNKLMVAAGRLAPESAAELHRKMAEPQPTH